MRERSVEQHLVAQCERRGAWCVKLAILQGAGWPDRTIIAPGGRIAFLELKRPGKRPDPLQRWVLKRLRALGCPHGWADTKEGVDAFLAGWLDG